MQPEVATRPPSLGWGRAIVSIFLLSLVFRLLFVWVQESYHVFDIYFVASDSRLYQALAQSVLSDAGYSFEGRPTALVTPVYPLFLAALQLMGIESPLAVGLVQCVVGAVTCVLIAVVGRHVGGG